MLVGCSAKPTDAQKQYTATFLELFDTVTTIKGSADSEQDFEAVAKDIHDRLEHYHRLFDIYNEYDGMNNLKTVNDKAALSPVAVDAAIIELLEAAKSYYTESGGKFNPAMGSVLSLWHTAREDGINNPQNAYLPDMGALQSAAQHMSPDSIILDKENSTVFFTDAALKLDVGAVAKGWAVQKVCQNAPTGLLISVGGNVYATGPKTPEGTPWSVGITNPFGKSEYLHLLNITHGSVVTSGSYQRTYSVGDKAYHHIIDPDTLYPEDKWVSVSVVTDDSGVADMLSTALFLLDREEGQRLLDRYGAHAMWVDAQGNKFYSPEFGKLVKK